MIGLKLVLLGHTKSEGFDDPWPVTLPGAAGALSSDSVGSYLSTEFFFYYRFYLNTKHSGAPFSEGWTEWPAWVPQLILRFDNAIEEVRRYNEIRSYRGVNHG